MSLLRHSSSKLFKADGKVGLKPLSPVIHQMQPCRMRDPFSVAQPVVINLESYPKTCHKTHDDCVNKVGVKGEAFEGDRETKARGTEIAIYAI